MNLGLHLVAAATLISVVSAGNASAAAGRTAAPNAVGSAFSCVTPTSFLSQGSPTQLYSGVYGPGSQTFSPLGRIYSSTYNALGFNPVNAYLYATLQGGNHLLQIDSTGAVTDLGAVSGLPVVSNAPTNGAFDPSGNYWITTGGTKTAYEINVTATPPLVIKTLTISAAWQPSDMSFAGGFMWGMSGTTIYRLDLASGAMTTFAAPSPIVSGTYGAAWTFSNGNLGFSNNGTGDIYQVSVTNPASSSPSFAVISHYTGPLSSTNDGAACIAPAVDLGISKTGPAQVAQGGTITWTLTVINHGPGNSSGFVVNDAVPAGVTNVASITPGCAVTGNSVRCSEGALSNGSAFGITMTGTASAAAGTCFTNTATVFGNEADPNPANDSSSVQTCVLGLTLVKSASIPSFSAAGTPITYSYKVTNQGTATLSAAAVTDDKLGAISCPSTSLAAGASMTCTAGYTTTQADVDAAGITNTATATGKAPDGTTLTAQSSVTVPAAQAPAITLAKSADTSSFSQPGTAITYSYKVTNSGNVTLDPVTVTDALPGLPGISCPATSLAPGASMTCTAGYTTTQGDLDSGSVANTATVTGHPPSGPDVTAQSSVTIAAVRSPGITLVKSSSLASFDAAGTPVTYNYLVTNSGNVTLDPVTVTDSRLGAVSCAASSLAPGDSMTCTAAYSTTQADVGNGSITNTATATGQPPSGPAVNSADTATVTVAHQPAIGLAKSAGVTSYSAAGTAIAYTYLVTNSGNATLSRIALDDSTFGHVNCPFTALAPGASMTCTANYTATQADVDNGSITNTASVAGTAPDGGTVTAQSTVIVPASQLPAITVDKSASPAIVDAAGTKITYTYLVANSGNVTLDPVTVTDDQLGAVSCPRSSLAPGASMTCTAAYTAAQADIDRAGVSNTGTAAGTPPSGVPVSGSSSVTVPADQRPAVTLAKTASPASVDAAGTVITYSYLVTNSGNVTLDPVSLTDDKLGPIGCPGTSLPPGASMTCTADYTTTQDDLDRASITNTGTAAGTAPDGSVATSRSPAAVTVSQHPAITLGKTASYASITAAGTKITYLYAVANTGNVTLNPVTVTDDKLGTITCPDTLLAPGGSMTCTARYTATQADVDNGGITNTGTASGTAPGGTSATADSPVTVSAAHDPAITLVKDASVPSFAVARTPVTYSFLVTNTGNLTLNPVSVSDDKLGAIACPGSSLAPGGSMTCTAVYATTQADVNNGGIANTGTATGQPPTGPPVSSQATFTVPAVHGPAIGIAKSANPAGFSAPGAVITYTYLVTNSGDVTLNPVTVTDDKLGAIACPGTSLTVGSSMTCTANYTTTQADVDNGSVTNAATATGTPPTGPEVSDHAPASVTADQRPALTLRKTVTPSLFRAAGTTVTYSYLVTNTGNVTLTQVTPSDPLPGLSAITCLGQPSVITLTPGTSLTCTATYRTTQADLDSGGVSNTAAIQGDAPNGGLADDQSTAMVTASRNPGISIVKSASPADFGAPGTKITYSYLVANTGNVTLDPVTVTDDKLGAISCPHSTPALALAPGASVTCTATYVTTQADVDHGGLPNTGTATGAPSTGPDVTASSSAAIYATQKPALSVAKSANVSGFPKPGVKVTYSYLVTNTGNVTLGHVIVTDAMPRLSKISCPGASLTPGASMTCTAGYTTTQADVNHRSISNTGTADGTAPDGTVVIVTGTVTVGTQQTPAIAIVRSASVTAGTKITYRYKVTDTGNVTLGHVIVTDGLPGLSKISCPRTSLAPGASMTCTASYTTTEADVARGSVADTSLVSGTAPSGGEVTAQAPLTIPVTPAPAIKLVKSASITHFTSAGTNVTYRYQVTNTGDVTLDPVTVTDTMPGLSKISCPHALLAPGASMTCTADYTTTQADVARGSVTNAGTAVGQPSGNLPQVRVRSTVRLPFTGILPWVPITG